MKKLIIGLTALLFSGLSSAYAGAGFKPLSVSGCATSIGVNQSLWIIGCSRIDASGYGIYQLYRRDLKGNFSWQQVSGSARTIAVSPEGVPWVINEQGAIFKWNGIEFQSVSAPGCATSIGVGTNDSAWIIGCSRVAGSGYGIYALRGNPLQPGATWEQVSGAARTIAVSPEGTPWVINEQGSIFRWNGSEFQSLSTDGCATSIGVGRNNAAWVIGCSRLSESGNGIYQLSGHPYSPGATWQQIPGAAKAIAVSSEGSPWVINEQGGIFSYSVR